MSGMVVHRMPTCQLSGSPCYSNLQLYALIRLRRTIKFQNVNA